MDGSHYQPELASRPIGPNHVHLSVSCWYANFSVSITPLQAYKLALELSAAAKDAERQAQEESRNG